MTLLAGGNIGYICLFSIQSDVLGWYDNLMLLKTALKIGNNGSNCFLDNFTLYALAHTKIDSKAQLRHDSFK